MFSRPTRPLSTAALTVAVLAALGAGPAPAAAASEADATAVIDLWPDGNPGGWSAGGDEEALERGDGIARVRNVNHPTLAYFKAGGGAPESGRPAVIVCPGGGYSILAIDHEGYGVAEFLASRGTDAFVLKYRLPRGGDNADDPRHGPALQDAQRAISIVRHRATELGIAPDRIGIMGFSAGGHLAAVTSTRFGERSYGPVDAADEASPRPDFAALIYPAYLVEKDDPSGTLSDDLVLTDEIPPTFFIHAGNDPVTAESSLFYYLALQRREIPAELHLYGEGGHGYGITKAKELPVGAWPERLADWIAWTTRPE